MSTVVSLRNDWNYRVPRNIPGKRVLIIDDQGTARAILDAIIHTIDSEIETKLYANPLEALDWIKSNAVDLVLVDYKMNELDGVETIRRLRGHPRCQDVPIVMVTIIEDRKVCHDAFDAGATDFLVKPFDQYECRARCRNLLTMREQFSMLRNRTKFLEFEIATAVQQLRCRERETILLAANLAEYHSHQGGFRIVRIARYAGLIAEGMGLPADMIERIELASTLQDIGKIGVADDILLADGNLTAAQEAALREHTEIGYNLLKHSSSEHLKMAAETSLGHHEHFDGSGYPKGVKGRDIPLAARIVAVATAFDCMTGTPGADSESSINLAMRSLRERKGTQFDPVCIEAFESQLDAISEVHRALRDASA